MKQYKVWALGLAALLSVASCHGGSHESKGMESGGARISFEDTLHRFGVIPLSQPVDSFDFVFSNTGKGWLVVLGVETSCHCTTASYEPRPVAPGEKSYIRVRYDGRGRRAEYFHKTVKVVTNAESVELCIEGKTE